MTIVTPIDGQPAVAEHVAQLTETLTGVRAEPITLTSTLSVGAKPVAVSPTAGNTLTWDATGLYAPSGGGGLDQATADGLYVNLGGDSATGQHFYSGPSGSGALHTQVTGDGQPRLALRTEGAVVWGSGSSTGDTTLQRTGVGVLGLTGSLNPEATNTRDLGTTALRWRKLWATDADLSGALNVAGASTFTSAPTVGGSPLLTQTAGDARYTQGGLTQATADTRYLQLATGGTVSGLVTVGAGGLRVSGSPTGYHSEVSFPATGANLDLGLSTFSTGSPAYRYDHRATNNTGTWHWRNGTGGANTRMILDGDGTLRIGGGVVPIQNNLSDLGLSGARWRNIATIDIDASGRIITAGNVGVGVTPAAWASGWRALQVGAVTSLADAAQYTVLGNNTYWDGTSHRALAAAGGTRFYQNNGAYFFDTAPSVAAGAAQTFTTRLTVNEAGNLGVGVSPGPWYTSFRTVQLGTVGAVLSDSSDHTGMYHNTYTGTDALSRAITTGPAARLALTTGGLTVDTFANTTAGGTHAAVGRFRIDNDGKLSVNQAAAYFTGTSPPAGGSGALPATPAGYWTVSLNGTNFKIPYYPV